jgi:hypothetical protein
MTREGAMWGVNTFRPGAAWRSAMSGSGTSMLFRTAAWGAAQEVSTCHRSLAGGCRAAVPPAPPLPRLVDPYPFLFPASRIEYGAGNVAGRVLHEGDSRVITPRGEGRRAYRWGRTQGKDRLPWRQGRRRTAAGASARRPGDHAAELGAGSGRGLTSAMNLMLINVSTRKACVAA